MKRIAALILVCLVWVNAVAFAQEYTLTNQTQTREIKEGDVVLATWQASFPQVGGLGDEAVQGLINMAITDRMEAEGGFQIVVEYAREDYQEDPERLQANGYGQEATAQATFQGEKLLCVGYQFIAYTGGPHPWSNSLSLLVSLETGEPVPFPELFRQEESVRALVTQEVQRQLEEREFPLEEEYREAVALWSWDRALLTPEGLRVVYDPEELGPYAAGTQEFLVGYDLLSEEWGDWGGPQDW